MYRLVRGCLFIGFVLFSRNATALVISPQLEALLIPSVGGGFQTISLENTYTNPVVVCTYNLPSAADGEAVVRIDAVSPGSFDVRLQALDPPAPPLAADSDVYCLVAEETPAGGGPYTLPGGVQFEAYTVLSTDTAGPDVLPGNDFSGQGEDVTALIQGTYAAPGVIGQVMSSNDAGFSQFWTHDCESSARNPFQVGGVPGEGICVGKHSGQSNAFRANETVGFIVFEAGSGISDSIRYEAALGADLVVGVQNGAPSLYPLGDDYGFAVASVSGMDGSDGGIAVLMGDDPAVGGTLSLGVDEESASDGERAHTTEQLAYWVFSESDFGDAPGSYNALSPPEHLVLAGFSVDPDDDLFIGADYSADDATVTDDSDVDDGGVVFPEIEIPSPGDIYPVDVPYTGDARLCGWIDFDINGQPGDGTFETDERVCVDTSGGSCTGGGVSGTCTLDFTIPADFVFDGTQETWARFRIGPLTGGVNPVESPTGLVVAGEVEDYRIEANTLPVSLNWFESRRVANRLRLKWQTATETFTIGFNVWGRVEGEWLQLNSGLIRTRRLDSVVPQTYRKNIRLRDVDGEPDALALTSVDFNGYEQGFGPFEPGRSYGEETVFMPVSWTSIGDAHAARMKERGYVWRNNRWRRVTASLARTLAREADGAMVLGHIGITRDGMVRLDHEELLANGIDLGGLSSRDIALTWRGLAVPRQVQGPGNRFGPGWRIVFHGEAPKGSDALYLSENRYQIGVDRSRALDVARIRRDPGNAGDTYLATTKVEEDAAYANVLPTGDPFHMGILFAPGGGGATWPAPGQPPLTIEVADDLLAGRPAYLEMNLAALSDPPGQDLDGDGAIDPDHVVSILVNGQPVTLVNPSHEGYGPWLVRGTIPADVLQPGNNDIRVEMVPNGYTQPQLMALDSYTVHYHRPALAMSGRLEIGPINQDPLIEADGFEVAGLGEGDISAFAFSPSDEAHPGSLVALQVRESRSPSGDPLARIPMVGDGAARYWISGVDAFFTAATIEPAMTSPDLLADSGDYLIIAHPGFLPSDDSASHPLNDYVIHKRAEGFDPLLVDYGEVVEQFGFGMRTPAALTNYLRAATERFDYAHVLLVGGDVYDYRDRLGSGAISFIPTAYTVTAERLQYTPSDALMTDIDGDGLPDRALGRWPVRDEQELGTIVAKTLQFSRPDTGLAKARTALLIAEEVTPQEQFDFTAQMDRIAQGLVSRDDIDPGVLVPWTEQPGAVERVDLQALYDDPAVPAADVVATARQQIVDSINQPGGRALTVFGGHGAPMNWSFSNLLTPSTVRDELANDAAPTLMMPMACYTTYYNEVHTDTLAHQLLFAGGQGAVAIHAAATLSGYLDNEVMGTRVVRNQLLDGNTLGIAIERARRSGVSSNVIVNWTLLGDPTLGLH